MTRMCLGRARALSAAVLLLTTSTTALAQNTAGRPATPGPVLEEIIVTGDRPDSFGSEYVQAGTFRNARVIDTPLTISVIPRELIDAQQALTILDALRNSAGVTTAQINSAIYNNLAIRGIPVENRGNYRLNGTLPIVNLIDLPLENKARVEALKGASALYYGFTTPSGIINLTTKRPGKDPVTDATLFGNSNGAVGAHVDVSRRFGEFGARVNAVGATVDTGIDRTDGGRSLGSVALDWEPTDKLKLQLDAEYIYKTVSEPTGWQLPAPTAGVIVLPALQDPKKNLGGKWMYGKGEEYNVLGRVQYDLAPNWSVSVDAGLSDLIRDRRYSAFRDYNLVTGNGTVEVTLTNGNAYRNEMLRAEIAGAFATGPLTHELVAGFSQNNRKTEVPSNPTVRYAQNLFDPRELPETGLPVRVIANPSWIRDRGYYVFDRVKVGEYLQVLAGVRKTEYSDISLRTRYETENTSYAGGVVVKPVEWVSIYGTFIEGLEAGGIAPVNAINANESLPAGTSEQWEVGLKVEPIDRLLLTVGYFDIERPSSFLNAARVFVQDGRTVYKGWELSATGEITEELSIYASALFLDAKTENAATAAVIGRRTENTAEFTGSLFLEYKLPFVEGLSISGGVFYVGDRAVNAANNAFVPGYTLVDVGARYNVDLFGNDTTFRLNVENVFDKKYWAATGSSLLGQGLPMAAKFSVTTRF